MIRCFLSLSGLLNFGKFKDSPTKTLIQFTHKMIVHRGLLNPLLQAPSVSDSMSIAITSVNNIVSSSYHRRHPFCYQYQYEKEQVFVEVMETDKQLEEQLADAKKLLVEAAGLVELEKSKVLYIARFIIQTSLPVFASKSFGIFFI
ncbi:hypothetical protein L2E82_20219 [Cichorium intybus]|uniref:Uncharacterized protein n=1 Tax=Cichorium intybus TaxID=13427 RepID=A0ACB9DT56_CICIN|nr:hypothetical protein L2E82_20219 [Cichorium intybus]